MTKVKMIKRNLNGKPEIKCPECGIIIQKKTSNIKIKMPYCCNCSKRIEDAEQKYCGHCGQKLNWD